MDFYEINRYCSPKSLLVVTPQGKLIRLYCPFKVICTESGSTLLEFEIYDVTSVLMTASGLIVFVVLGESYQHSIFRICASP